MIKRATAVASLLWLIAAAAPAEAGQLVIKKLGEEFIVSGATQGLSTLEVDALANGGFAVTWAGLEPGDNGPMVRLYDTAGAPVGPALAVGDTDPADLPAAAAIGDAGLALLWRGPISGSNQAIRGRRISPTGTLGKVVEIKRLVPGLRKQTAAASLTGDRVVIVYNVPYSPYFGLDLSSRILDAGLNPLGEDRPVKYSEKRGDQFRPSVAGLSTGGFVATWTDGKEEPFTPAQEKIKFDVFRADGIPQGALNNERTVDTTAALMQRSAVAGLTNGEFVVVWMADEGLKAQAFNNDRNKVGNELSFSSSRGEPAVASFPNGRYIVGWTGEDSDGDGVRLQVVSPAGQKIGPERVANTKRSGQQRRVSIAVIDARDFVVVWLNGLQDIRGQRFRLTW